MLSGWRHNHAHIGNMISTKHVFEMKWAHEVWKGKCCMDGGGIYLNSCNKIAQYLRFTFHQNIIHYQFEPSPLKSLSLYMTNYVNSEFLHILIPHHKS